MPASHSKRNTSLAFFTSYERSLLKTAWGSQKARLNRDSFLPFGSCQLCLLPSREPVACQNGDLFCRECALSNLLAQRKEITRLEKEWERRVEDEQEKKLLDEVEEQERAVQDFERVQMGLNGKSRKRAAEDTADEEKQRKAKKKFELDEEELLKGVKEERQRMRTELDAEKKAATKHNPSFWVPSAQSTHESSTKDSKPPKLQPLCPCSSEDKPHGLSLKTLTTINFTTEQNRNTREDVRTCPACRKALSNSTKAVMAVPCGHVLCKPCSDKFLKPQANPDPHNLDSEHDILRCYVCDADLTSKHETKGGEKDEKSKKKSKKDKGGVKPGLLEFRTDGTGYAGGGKSEVEKKGIAFQC